MLLLWIVGLLEGIFVDLRAPSSVSWSPFNFPRPATRFPRRRLTPEWPTGFL
jgi:hypothetical protein